MYFSKIETIKGTFSISDQYRKGKKVYIVYRIITDNLYQPAFPGIVFGTVDAAIKAIENNF